MSLKKTIRELEPFDYGKSKEEFKRIQDNYIHRKRKGIVEGKVQLWTREKVDIYIDIILKYKRKNDSYLTDEEMSKYNVVSINGVHKLVLKRKRYRGQRIEVVPFEDCFDKIMPFHRRLGHNEHFNNVMYKELTKKYVIDKMWVFLIQRSCNFCKSDVKLNLDFRSLEPFGRLNKCFQIMVTPVTLGESESQHVMLMVVVDKSTNFVFLRPLVQYDDYSVIVELVKIFTDFGIPKMIETKETILFSRVIKSLPKFNKEFKTHLIPMQYKNYPFWCNRVIGYLEEWLKVNETKDWVSGCPIVQWQMNNIRMKDNTSPYKELFNKEPVKNLIFG